ncbi:adenosylcobinamide-phosphate synthase CbiB [Fusibacter sp. JL298sf-3]
MIQILFGIGLDSLIGDPPNWPHPVRFIGWAIKQLEKVVRRGFKNLYVGGFFLLVLTWGVTLAPLVALKAIAPPFFYFIVQLYLAYSLLATKCLADEGMKVQRVLQSGDLAASRKALSWLVGRDTTSLTESEVTAGAVETVAENTIDGTLAPLFYMVVGAVFGDPILPLILYKATNTLDSMVGYIQPPYKEIGYCSAKMDDLLNYVPARLGAVLMLFSGALCGLDFRNGLKVLVRDRRNHKSPNCGYPEAAIAGLLNIRLGGTHTYFGQVLVKPTLGDDNRPIEPMDITRAVRVLRISQWVIAAGLLVAMGLGGFYEFSRWY